MPTIEFVASAAGHTKTIEAPEGGELVDLCDEHLAPIPFSCRSASCATCEIEVLGGAEFLLAPNEEERTLLELLGDKPGRRLACQARVLSGEGRLQVRAVAIGPGNLPR